MKEKDFLSNSDLKRENLRAIREIAIATKRGIFAVELKRVQMVGATKQSKHLPFLILFR